MPCGIESWRKPAVLENTSTFSSGASSSTVIDPVMPGVELAQERVGARRGERLRRRPRPVGRRSRRSSSSRWSSGRVRDGAWSNSQRTVSPARSSRRRAPSAGRASRRGRRSRSVAAAACPAASSPTVSTAASASSTTRVRRMDFPLPLDLTHRPLRAPTRAPFGGPAEEYTRDYKVSSDTRSLPDRQKFRASGVEPSEVRRRAARRGGGRPRARSAGPRRSR